MIRYVTEFIGTFFLVFTVGMAVIEPGVGPLAPLAIGSVLAAMIYAGGHVSGAHYNPAVTLAVWLRRKIDGADAILYVVAQVAAGLVAALCVGYLKGGAEVTPIRHDVVASLLAEVLFTFALCYVILSTAMAEATEGNSYFGAAIGLTVVAGAWAVGSVSGGAFNPAVALGISQLGLSPWGSLWIYLAAALVAGFGAAFVFGMTHPDEADPSAS